jgi:ubiquitin-conjugating enzyme E2 C
MTNRQAARLASEARKLEKAPVAGCTLAPDGDNLLVWLGTVEGPPESFYKGLTFRIRLEVPEKYPYAAVRLQFLDVPYHPLIDVSGVPCLNMINKWAASTSFSDILTEIIAILANPAVDQALRVEAGQDFTEPTVFSEKARIIGVPMAVRD